MKSLNYKDNFDLLCLRHGYFKKIKSNKADIKKHEKITVITGKKMFLKYQYSFESVNFTTEDVISICRVYTFIFMSLYSFDNEETLNKFQKRFLKINNRYPTEKELEDVERNNLIGFIRQKIGDCSMLCERKAKNIRAKEQTTIFIKETQKSKVHCEKATTYNYKDLGYRKITKKEFKKIAKKDPVDFKDDNGFKALVLNSYDFGISYQQYPIIDDIIANNQTEYTRNPEEMFLIKEKDVFFNNKKSKFNNLTQSQKRRMLSKFINENKSKPYFKKEISLAKQMLFNKNILL
jgi:hypothetical protein